MGAKAPGGLRGSEPRAKARGNEVRTAMNGLFVTAVLLRNADWTLCPFDLLCRASRLCFYGNWGMREKWTTKHADMRENTSGFFCEGACSIPSNPSIDKSSSIDGQCMPHPDGDISYFSLSILKAFDNLFEIFSNRKLSFTRFHRIFTDLDNTAINP